MDAFGCRNGLKIAPNRRKIFRMRIAIITTSENIQALEISRPATSPHAQPRKYATKDVVSDLGGAAFISTLPTLFPVGAKIPFANAMEIFLISTKKLRPKTPTR